MFDDTLEKNLFLGEKITDEKKQKALKLLEIFGLRELEESQRSFLKCPLEKMESVYLVGK